MPDILSSYIMIPIYTVFPTVAHVFMCSSLPVVLDLVRVRDCLISFLLFFHFIIVFVMCSAFSFIISVLSLVCHAPDGRLIWLISLSTP